MKYEAKIIYVYTYLHMYVQIYVDISICALSRTSPDSFSWICRIQLSMDTRSLACFSHLMLITIITTIHMVVSIKWGHPKKDSFFMENHLILNEWYLGVPLFQETSIWYNHADNGIFIYIQLYNHSYYLNIKLYI